MAAPNIVTAPEDFTDASWTAVNSGVTPNNALAPDGTLTADLIVPSAVSNTIHAIWDLCPVVAGNDYFGSVFVEPAGYDHYIIQFGGGPFAGVVTALFDITNEVLLDSDNGNAAIYKGGGVINIGGGRYRIYMQSDAQSTGNMQFFHGPVAGSVTSVRTANDGYNAYTPDGVSGANAWGAQFEITDLTPYTAVSGAVIPAVDGYAPRRGSVIHQLRHH